MRYHKRNKLINGYKSTKHPLYSIWTNMKARCLNSNCNAYSNYGGRGITICYEWINSFEKFASDMKDKPNEKYTLDRIDNNDDYCKENCKWSTRLEQNLNKRVYTTSKTGYSGIQTNKQGNFIVRTKGSNRKRLGIFENLEEAIEAQKNNIKSSRLGYNNTTGIKNITRSGDGYIIRAIVEGKRVYLGYSTDFNKAKNILESYDK